MSASSKGHARVYNSTKGILLASRAEVADSLCTRLVGLLGRRAFSEGEGMWLVPGNSIHTIGMRFSIDVLMVGRDSTVVALREMVRPFSVIWPNVRARSVLELPADTIARTRTECGDQLHIEIGEA